LGIGLVGGSIEDATGDKNNPIYELEHAVARITAAAEMKRELPFLLTARAENFLWGKQDFNDTLIRIQAYADAPVNVVMGLTNFPCTVRQLSEIGVKRISVGGSFARAALGELVRAAIEVRDEGTFGYSSKALPGADAEAYMSQSKTPQRLSN